MWMVLCDSDDLSALWAAQGLKSRGLQPLEIITPEMLVYNRQFLHHLTTFQRISQIVLADGRVINSGAICGTLNRLQFLPLAHLKGVTATDRLYAEQELYALFLSWLNCLPDPVLNRPTAQGLSGAWRHQSEWIWMASQAGLATMLYCQGDKDTAPLPQFPSVKHTITVVNDTCFGSVVPPTVASGSVRLGELSQTSLLGIDFQITSDGNWIFLNAQPLPDLRLGGEDLLDFLSTILKL